jgi:hypothetical protein
MFKKLWAKIVSYFQRKVAPEANKAIVDPLRPSMKAAVNKAADDVLLKSTLGLSMAPALVKSALTAELQKRGIPGWLSAALVSFVDTVEAEAKAQESATRAVEFLRAYLLDRAGNARF